MILLKQPLSIDNIPYPEQRAHPPLEGWRRLSIFFASCYWRRYFAEHSCRRTEVGLRNSLGPRPHLTKHSHLFPLQRYVQAGATTGLIPRVSNVTATSNPLRIFLMPIGRASAKVEGCCFASTLLGRTNTCARGSLWAGDRENSGLD